MQKSESINELATALATAQGQIENAVKDADNPFFKSTYADLASIRDAIRKPFSENGLCVMQPVSVDGPKVIVTTILAHSSGQWVSSDLAMTAQRQILGGAWEKIDTPQAIGSAIAYARRYALAAIAAVATEDDDGEGTEGRVITISDGQAKRVFSLMREAGKKPAEVLEILKRHGYARTEEIAREKYESICAEVSRR
jgi:hypothetical protein